MKQRPIWGRFMKKKQKPKISCYCPFNTFSEQWPTVCLNSLSCSTGMKRQHGHSEYFPYFLDTLMGQEHDNRMGLKWCDVIGLG
jgi:hypothetical protein